MLERELHRPIGSHLARLAQQFDGILAVDADQMQVLDLLRPVDLVQRERIAHREVDLLVLADVLDFCLQPEVQLGQPLGHLKLERGFAVLEQLEIRHFFRGRHAVQIGRRDRQPHVLQHRQRHRDAVQVQLRPDHDQRLVAGQQRFAVHVDAGGQDIVLRLVLEFVQRAEIAVREDDLLLGWSAGERDGDLALVIGRVLAAGEPQRGGGQLAVLFVQHREHMTAYRGADQVPQPTLADHGAAALAAADEVDHVNAGLVQFGELEMPPHSPQRRFGVREGRFLIGHQPVQVDVGVHFAQVGAVVVPRVDLEHLDDQRADVLDVQVQADRRFGGEQPLVVERKVEVHAFLQGLVLGGRQQRVPLLAFAQSVHDLRFRELAFQVGVEDERLVGFVVRRVDKEVLQVAADQRFVVAHRRQQRHAGVVRAQVGGKAAVLRLVQKLRPDVAHLPRQLQIRQEPVLVEQALRPVQNQPVIDDVRLERVVYGRQLLGERPQTVQVRALRVHVILPVGVGIRLQPAQVHVDELTLVQQVGLQFQAFVQLRQQQQLVDGERPESAAVGMIQVVDDQLRQIGIVGPLQPLQQVPPQFGLQFHGHEPIEGRIFKALEILVLAHRPFGQRRAADQFRVQLRGQIRLGVQLFPLVIELQIQLLAEVIQRFLRIGGIGQQGLAIEDFADCAACNCGV